MTSRFDADVLVAGGGLVGLTLGIALAKAGLETVVVEAQDPATVTGAGFDGRVSAIAYASVRMLTALGLWDRMAADAQPINDIVVSDGTVEGGAAPLFLHFDHREIGVPLGHLVENRHTRIAQQAEAERTDGLALRGPARIARLTAEGSAAVATLASGETLRARVALAADGRESPLRAAAGLKTIGWSYGQTGIVVTMAHEKPHEGIAQEYFLPSGPFAILPMTGDRASLVWTERTADAQRILALPEAAFVDEARRRFGDYLGKVAPVGPRFAYPLVLQLARNYVAPRLALVGDAAHAIHPIAGQGLNLGLRDVAALTEVLVDAARLGRDIGAPDVLAEYERWRRFDSVAFAASTDLLNALFSNDIAPVRAARDVGLAVTNRIGPLRRFFMRHAGGDVGVLPKLLRGEAV